MIEELKNIWRACFNDADAYIDFYFSERYCPKNTFVHCETGRGVAMMTLLPATVVTPHEEFAARYVYAVATLPEFRNKGISFSLAQQADEQARTENCALEIVVPATPELFHFYARQGFSTTFYHRIVEFSADEIAPADVLEGTPLQEAETFFTLRERYFATDGFFVRWDSAALQYILKESRLLQGDVYYFSQGDDDGYVVVEPKNNIMLLKEVALTPALAPAALHFLKQRYAHCRRFICHLAVNSPLWAKRGTTEPLAMLKWLIPPPAAISTVHAYVNLLKN
ncbi:MAG: GNAT family N-acetyltransferase [Prevotellaceae bacterium]|jgi:GNAT superfamily N-acetyltransferase|nr:GNAT family N-acetyltransferase [Prevotellaceae bacterium]